MIISLKFYLNEKVTPEIFCLRVANACSKGGAIRPGEQIGTASDSVRYEAIEPTVLTSAETGLPFELHDWIRPV